MKILFAAISLVALLICSSSAKPEKLLEVSGYPVYRFINLGEINAKALKKNEESAKALLGEHYEAYVKHHQLFVAHGFDLHFPLTIILESGKKIEVYIPAKDYDELWSVSPRDLAKQKKSHRVTIKYVRVEVGGDTANRAVKFNSELVDRDPILRK